MVAAAQGFVQAAQVGQVEVMHAPHGEVPMGVLGASGMPGGMMMAMVEPNGVDIAPAPTQQPPAMEAMAGEVGGSAPSP